MTRKEQLTALREAVRGSGLPEDAFCPLFHDAGLCTECDGAYHGSLDAARALHDALLPGWDWHKMNDLVGVAKDGAGVFSARHENPARAWLLAILDALIAQADSEEWLSAFRDSTVGRERA